MPNNPYKSSPQSGLTIVEIVVAMVIATILMIGLIPLLTHMFTVAGANIATSKQVNEAQRAISIISSDLMITKAFLGQSFADTKAPRTGADTYWKFNTSPQQTLILRLPATTKLYQDPARDLVYNANSGACGSTAQPFYINVIYYVSSGSLYRRILQDPNATPCSGQTVSQVATCQSGCAQTDVKVLEKITSFNVSYYTLPNAATPDNTSGVDPATGDLSSRRGIGVSLTNTTTVDGKQNDYSLSTREWLVW
jgi:type II secretory pathway component PulJ